MIDQQSEGRPADRKTRVVCTIGLPPREAGATQQAGLTRVVCQKTNHFISMDVNLFTTRALFGTRGKGSLHAA